MTMTEFVKRIAKGMRGRQKPLAKKISSALNNLYLYLYLLNIRVSTNYVILFRTYEIRDEIMLFCFRMKVLDLRDAKNENRFFSF